MAQGACWATDYLWLNMHPGQAPLWLIATWREATCRAPFSSRLVSPHLHISYVNYSRSKAVRTSWRRARDGARPRAARRPGWWDAAGAWRPWLPWTRRPSRRASRACFASSLHTRCPSTRALARSLCKSGEHYLQTQTIAPALRYCKYCTRIYSFHQYNTVNN